MRASTIRVFKLLYSFEEKDSLEVWVPTESEADSAMVFRVQLMQIWLEKTEVGLTLLEVDSDAFAGPSRYYSNYSIVYFEIWNFEEKGSWYWIWLS